MCQPVYTYKSQATKSKSTHSPLFDIQLPSNSSYVVTLEFSAPESSSSSSSRGEAEFFSNPSSLRPTLTLVVESKSHHVFLFYLKVTIQIWPKKFVLGCAIPPAGAVARSRNLGHNLFFANSVQMLKLP